MSWTFRRARAASSSEAARRIVHEALKADTSDALRDALEAIVLGFSGSEVSPFPYFLTEVNLLLQVSRLLGRLRELGEPLDDFVLGVVPADTLASRSGASPGAESPATGAYALIPADVEKRNAFERIRDDEFDLIVGNPPYVAEAGNKVLFQRLRTLPQWKGVVKGKTDWSDPGGSVRCLWEFFAPLMMGEEGRELMKRRRHTPEQIIRKLREADRMLGEGATIPEVAKALEVSENTFHRWRAQYGGMKADDAKRLRELKRENERLKRIVADQALENRALKEVAKGNW